MCVSIHAGSDGGETTLTNVKERHEMSSRPREWRMCYRKRQYAARGEDVYILLNGLEMHEHH